jgi:hypothetical protein
MVTLIFHGVFEYKSIQINHVTNTAPYTARIRTQCRITQCQCVFVEPVFVYVLVAKIIPYTGRLILFNTLRCGRVTARGDEHLVRPKRFDITWDSPSGNAFSSAGRSWASSSSICLLSSDHRDSRVDLNSESEGDSLWNLYRSSLTCVYQRRCC